MANYVADPFSAVVSVFNKALPFTAHDSMNIFW